MKVKIATLLLCVAFSMPMIAQRKTDSFFSYQQVDSRLINTTPVPASFGEEMRINNMDVNATPLNDGLLVLTMVSLAYCLSRRKEVVK